MKKLSLCTLLMLAFLGIGAGSNRLHREVVGLWKQSNDWHHFVFMRRADGTYREKGLMLFDPWKSPVPYESTGDWRLQSGQYFVTARSWSEPTFQGSVGKICRRKVIRVDKQRFCYVSTDGADEEEQKIGDVSDAEFERTKVDPFQPEIIRSVKKAMPVVP